MTTEELHKAVAEFRKLDLPRPDPGDGYALSDWVFYDSFEHLPLFRAFVWKDGVLPPPNTAVRAEVIVHFHDAEHHAEHLTDLVAIKVEVARMSCDDMIRWAKIERAEA